MPDNPEPSIAVLAPRFAGTAIDNGGKPGNAERVRQLWDKVGGGLREWRNSLVMVAPDHELWSRAGEAVREVLAYDDVIASAQRRAIDLSENRDS